MNYRLVILCSIFLAACDQQSRGFSLPEGDVERGRTSFVELGCQQCHRVIGDAELELSSPDGAVQVDLGGRVTRIKTYGDLVTSVINPSHKISSQQPGATENDGQSSMRVYNDVMTVQQLVDLVAYLQETYEVHVPETWYPMYP